MRLQGYQTQIQGVCSKLKLMAIVETNFKVGEMHAIITAPSFAVVKAVQNINNCPLPSRIFQGRQAILDKMHQFFNTDSGNQHIYVLYGLGGAGKTQIALKFIEQSSFSNVFLLDTSKVETIDTGLKGIAVSKSAGDSAQDALMWLQSNDNNWLLFFDNADDPKINLNDFLPKCSHGNIIITSRNPELRSYGAHTLVSDMEEADAITLLLRRANKESSEENLKLATGIVKELYYLPLAIIQASAFISKSEDLKGYLALYHSNRARLLSEKAAQSHDDYAQTVFTTWQISFNQLSHLAATLLQLCSFLHYTGISEDMFSAASKYDFPSWSPPKEELQEPLEFLSHFVEPTTGEWNSLKFLDITNEIKAYSLISFDVKTKLFSIHPLVHAWSHSTLPDETPLQSWMSSILGMCITEIPDDEMELASVQLIPHIVLLEYGNPDRVADFRRAFWRIYYYTGKFKDAQAIAEQVLERSKFLLGDDHPDTLLAMHDLASTYFDLGEFQKAMKPMVLVLEKYTKLLGEDHPHTLSTMGNLASIYSKLGEFQKAKELEVLVLEKRTKLLGEDHPDTLLARNNLASTYHDLCEFQKAQELMVLVLEKHTKLLGEDHPRTLSVMGNLASIYFKLGEFQKAKELEILVLEKRTKLLGEDHPGTLLAMSNLARTYWELGKLQKAMELEVLVLEKRTKILGEDHPDTLLAMENLARTYSDLEEFQKEEELEVPLLEKRRKLLGVDHPETLTVMANLAVTHYTLGDLNKALGLEVEVLQKRRQLLGDKHPDTILAMENLEATYQGLSQQEEMEELEQLIEDTKKLLL
ncbi:P-loop containing nucleoside triphosphate hydrolase protein [Mycena metata]|uniref:P-loop containing nucleoside triphosphate hydrolase protein n=1 Tax=Mycena metata TaxID=1033252 RepID=A0AAD7NAM0_9AGAR|nr:P-loop containing nucleoside triphosphate hydrolase protein [Mycena metata]